MARRVPKPLVPLLVAVAAIGLATAAALPSFAGPNVTPGSGGAEPPTPPAATAPASTPSPIPQPTTSSRPPEADAPQKGGDGQGPRDCVNCGQPSRD
ncbi:hypothetical protein [Actinoplanes sp. NBRC 103695]|uniref:hypothetical protein n=1 Tax=Actinoplanes sp. NBRC 103695 TaxID=3032202 RepID=UPI0024A21FCF|nr:hypothetical protein [Actinoplanes sp. NBRC 103695]GLY95501.1 hypothetical protein Acsp02_27560 [Actinoplanes sp. NBRC 103695]